MQLLNSVVMGIGFGLGISVWNSLAAWWSKK